MKQCKYQLTNERSSTYLAADGEERSAGGVHKDDLGLTTGDIVVNAKHEIPLAVKDGEAVAVEKQRFLPHRKYHSVAIGLELPVGGSGGVGINLGHSPKLYVMTNREVKREGGR